MKFFYCVWNPSEEKEKKKSEGNSFIVFGTLFWDEKKITEKVW